MRTPKPIPAETRTVTRRYKRKVPYELIIETYESGLSYKQTAAKLGLSFAQVAKIVQTYGNPRPPGRSTPEVTNERVEEMGRLYLGPPKLTMQQVGDLMGISRQRVSQLLLQHGYETRPVGPLVLRTEDRALMNTMIDLLRVVWPLDATEAAVLTETIELIIAERLEKEGYTPDEAMVMASSLQQSNNGNGKEKGR